jgi:photosystem II stability/assembly factor-like uncharacterized protein
VLVALAAAAPAVAAPVRTGQSGWAWGDPRPQGNTIRSLAFAGGKGFAVGDFGTALRTDDGGATWVGLSTGITDTLTEVRAISATSVVIGGGCTALRSDDGGTTFKRLPFTPSSANCRSGLTGLAFPTSQAGFFMLGDGTVLSTADGGQTFQRGTAVPGTTATGGNAVPTDVEFLDATHGFAVTSGAGGTIYRTADGAGSWTSVATAGAGLNAIRFASPTVGYAVGNGGAFLKTVDGGATWTAQVVSIGNQPISFASVSCADASTCVFTTTNAKQVIRTIDGGATFSAVAPATQGIHAAAFASVTRVIAAGDQGVTRASDDAGATFPPVHDRLGDEYDHIVQGPVDTTAFAIGSGGALARTTDGGATWASLGVPTSDSIADVSFPTATTGFAIDDTGHFFRTTNGGTGWGSFDTGTSAVSSKVIATSATNVLLVGASGLRRSTDGGDSFSAVRSGALTKLRAFGADQAGTALLVFGGGAVAESTNHGGSWTRLKLPSKKAGVRDVDFLDAKRGYLLDAHRRLWVTRNGGRRWSAITTLGTTAGQQISFSSLTRGFLALNTSQLPYGEILRTTDGGKSWRPQIVSPARPIEVVAPSDAHAYALGGATDLFSTTTGGDAGTPSTLTISPSKKRVKKNGFVTINGKLSGATGGEHVTVFVQQDGRSNWGHFDATVGSNGRFSIRARLTRGATFVAQWTGDATHAGDGTTAQHVAVG